MLESIDSQDVFGRKVCDIAVPTFSRHHMVSAVGHSVQWDSVQWDNHHSDGSNAG